MEGEIPNCANCSLSSLSLPRPEDHNGSNTNKRRLLLIYIHGFMGSEASFHDLPAHVHDLLTCLLSESHEVFTRIYPRYKSHGELQTAVNQFSAWLSPHEADDLDVILLGHSLGGILAADVALLQVNGRPKHRILGLVNFDVPFLGMHPRVIPTGIGSSMPKKDVAAEDKLAAEEESVGLKPAYRPAAPSPNFNPPFKNDVKLANRGFLKGMMHFVNKNTDNLSRSIFDRVVSSVKFAGCTNNFPELRQRYRRLVELESAENSPGRVRFINYYTSSTGRIKPKKKSAKEGEATDQVNDTTESASQALSETPRDSKETEPTISTTINTAAEEQNMKYIPPDPMPVTEETSPEKQPEPEEDPPTIEPATSADTKEAQNSTETISTTTSDPDPGSDTSKRKLRNFILLPSHHWKYDTNSHWTPVIMEDMDEVTAHQSMFIPHCSHYEHLIGDTVALIEQWVQNDLTRRLLQESLD
ncbi:hypothetical protein PHISCL_01174 [Aspergillus sclerotialis]|uniref:AB hydrolase-1 domain-containing protein n=1 Tax=Aspergillus sclerotialis TaxID=2070753 RepID=A0A3A3A424_9EURO|nr:hypothetical protein PHISCL_01174 [Aspergillus sclerotialis]